MFLGFLIFAFNPVFAYPEETGFHPAPESYLLVEEGEFPLILEAPHGGDRIVPGFEVNPKLGGKDAFTLELTLLVSEKIQALTGKKPSVIAMLANRNYIEANRKPGPEAYTTDFTRILYELYYEKIKELIQKTAKKHQTGLMVSIHSGWTMSYEIEIGVNAVEKWSTIPVYLKKNSWDSFHGEQGIGGRLARLGYEVPGFKGIPWTKGWTGTPALIFCRKEQNMGVDGMQFEFFASKLLRDPEKREKLAEDLAKVLAAFVKKHYGK